MILSADTEKNLLRAFIALFRQPFLQPFDIQPHPFQILIQDAAVHNDLSANGLLRRGKVQIGRIHRALGADRQNGQLAVLFVDCGLDVV